VSIAKKRKEKKGVLTKDKKRRRGMVKVYPRELIITPRAHTEGGGGYQKDLGRLAQKRKEETLLIKETLRL